MAPLVKCMIRNRRARIAEPPAKGTLIAVSIQWSFCIFISVISFAVTIELFFSEPREQLSDPRRYRKMIRPLQWTFFDMQCVPEKVVRILPCEGDTVQAIDTSGAVMDECAGGFPGSSVCPYPDATYPECWGTQVRFKPSLDSKNVVIKRGEHTLLQAGKLVKPAVTFLEIHHKISGQYSSDLRGALIYAWGKQSHCVGSTGHPALSQQKKPPQ